MTIRRHVDLSAASTRLWNLQMVLDNSTTLFPQLRDAVGVVGEQCDAFLGAARHEVLGVCNGDGIREIEALMFEMLARNALPDLAKEIEMADFYAAALIDRTMDEQNDLIHRVERNASLIKSMADLRIVVREQEEAEGKHSRPLVPDERAELQQTGFWAIMEGLAFRQGGFKTKEDAEAQIERNRADYLAAMNDEPDLNDDEDQYAQPAILGNADY